MSRTTFRLKGAALKRCLHQVVASRGSVSESASERIAGDLAKLIASAEVRRITWSRLARKRRVAAEAKTQPAVTSSPKEIVRRSRRGQNRKAVPQQPSATEPTPTAPDRPAHQPSDAMFVQAPPSPDFDPYAFGLIPVYQREGSEGLRSKLDTIENVDHLRSLARAQQIGLPASIRRGDVAADSIRDAIISAVEKRIADRRAAAS